MQEYSDFEAELQDDFSLKYDRIREIIERRKIPMRRIALAIGISPAGLHKALVQKRNGLNDRHFISLCKLLNIEIRYSPSGIEIFDLELTPNDQVTQRRITESNINQLETAFYMANQAKMEAYNFRLSEYEFELEEFILGNNGSNILVKLLPQEEKYRINSYCVGSIYHSKSIAEKIIYCHNSHFRIADENTILRAAVRTNLRKNIGEWTTELKKAQFPDGFSWDLCNYETIPF